MTSNTDKFRALFLAALMVVSVFGATAAFAGGAGAVTVSQDNPSAGDAPAVDGTDAVIDDRTSSELNFSYNASVNDQNVTLYDSNDNVLNTTSPGSTGLGSVLLSASDLIADGEDSAELTVSLNNSSGRIVNDTFTVTSLLSDADADEYLEDGDTYWHGQVLVDSGVNTSKTYEVRDNETGNLATQVTTTADGTVTIDTADLEAGNEYFLESENNDKLEVFEVATQDLTVEFADDSVDNAGGSTTTDLEISSNRGTFDLVVSAELDGEAVSAADLNDSFVQDATEGDEEVTITDVTDTENMNFSGLDAGDYDYTFSVADTSAEDTDNITVNEVGAGELDFTASTYEGQQGDVIPVTVEFLEAADSGTLLIGSEADDGYQANVSIEANGEDEVTVLFNTYTAGMNGSATASEVVALQGDTDAELGTDFDQTGLNDILDTGDYELAVSSTDAAEAESNPDALSTLFVDERSTDAVNLWRTSQDVSDFESVSDIAAGMGENVTETEMVTGEDVLVTEVEASGLNGLLEDNGADVDDSEVVTDAFFDAFNSSDGLYLEVAQQNPESNQDAAYLNVSNSSDAVEVLSSADGDALYVVVDMGSTSLEFENADGEYMSDYELTDGHEFEATFTVSDNYLLDSTDSDDHQDVSSAFTFEEATSELTEDPYDLEAVEDAEVVAESNIAPGHEFDLRIRGSGDARFYQTVEDVVLQTDGTLSATFDLSDRAVDEEYDLRLRFGGAEVDSVTGTIVEAEEEVTTTEPTTTEPTTTEPTTTEPTTEETTEETTTEETTEETTTTSQQTPGFGIAVAMLALIGAALIALRRRN